MRPIFECLEHRHVEARRFLGLIGEPQAGRDPLSLQHVVPPIVFMPGASEARMYSAGERAQD
jgi:hypothetical protein